MKGYLIDPFEQTITGVLYDGDYRQIYHLIQCQTFDVKAFIDEYNDLYIDDEGLYVDDQSFFGFNFTDEIVIAGRALVLGHDNQGGTTDTTLTLDFLKNVIEWKDKTFERPEPFFEFTFVPDWDDTNDDINR